MEQKKVLWFKLLQKKDLTLIRLFIVYKASVIETAALSDQTFILWVTSYRTSGHIHTNRPDGQPGAQVHFKVYSVFKENTLVLSSSSSIRSNYRYALKFKTTATFVMSIINNYVHKINKSNNVKITLYFKHCSLGRKHFKMPIKILKT